MELFKSKKITIKNSPVHGFGVFAIEDILENELLEECHCYILTERSFDKVDSGIQCIALPFPIKAVGNKMAIVMGYGSLFNHSDSENAKYVVDLENKLYKFYSTKFIKANSEIFINYYN